MRCVLLCLAALPLSGCEPAAARETPIDLKPGQYAFELPAFIPAKLVKEDGYCVKNGAEQALPGMLIKLPFEALGKCQVHEPMRKGNYLTIAGTCNPPDDVAAGTMAIEGIATVEPKGVFGSFKVDLANIEKTTGDAKKAAIMTKLVRFKFQANWIGDC